MKTPDSPASLYYLRGAHIEHTSKILHKDPNQSSFFHAVQFKLDVKEFILLSMPGPILSILLIESYNKSSESL